MEWKQKIFSTLTDLKGKRHLSLWIAGAVLLLMYLPYCILMNHANRREIEAMLEDLETLKKWKTSQSSQPALENEKGLPLVSKARHRKRREVDTDKNSEHGSKYMTNGGAVYIRWGRTTCPSNYTELVYSEPTFAQYTLINIMYLKQNISSGFRRWLNKYVYLNASVGGGSFHDHPGAATNLQCLPDKPDWGRFTDSGGNAYMYGMEYDEAMTGIMDMSNIQNSLTNHNVPWSVCRSTIRTSSLMIPAKNICFEGWHLEYHGYLMAGHYNSKSGTQYICVDESPEADPAGYRSEDGAVLYRVVAQCGSLPCPRYVNDRELTCAVCTK